MAKYLIMAKYSAAGAAGARAEGYAVRQAEGSKAFESVGGTIEQWMWLDWGEWDFAIVVNAPSYEAVLRIASVSAASGAFAQTRAYPVFDSAAMEDAGSSGVEWRAPGAG